MSEPTTQLEDAIRAELRGEVRLAPAGAATKASVLRAVAGVPMDQGVRHLRRWVVPMLAAAAVVLVAVGVTVAPRVLSSHRAGPAHKPSPVPSAPELPAPKPGVAPPCLTPDGTMVNGAHTTYRVSATGETRYVFEYYCASSDGSRTPSSLQVFRLVAGVLRFQQEITNDTIVLSLTGARDGFRAVEAFGFTGAGMPPDVIDTAYHIPFNGTRSGGTEVAPGCRPADLTVRLGTAQLPSPHQVLQLTNRATTRCAVWGNPRYTPLTAAGQVGSQPVRYLLRGPAGGVSTAPSAPVILLQPGATAGASIGTDPQSSSCTESTAVRVTLPNGVDLGLQDVGYCNFVSYPLVVHAGGDDSADYPTVQQPTLPGPCEGSNQLLLSEHPVSSQSGDAAGLVFTIKLLAGPPCALTGYPTVRAVDGSNTVLVTAAHTRNGTLGGLPDSHFLGSPVTLKAGQTASALVEWSAAAYTPTSTCHRNGRVSLTFGATGATYHPTISQICDLVVHPFVPGDTGSQ